MLNKEIVYSLISYLIANLLFIINRLSKEIVYLLRRSFFKANFVIL